MDEEQLQRSRMMPRFGSTRSAPRLLLDGRVGLPSTLWNSAVPLGPDPTCGERPVLLQLPLELQRKLLGDRRAEIRSHGRARNQVRIADRGKRAPGADGSMVAKELGAFAGSVVTIVNGNALKTLRKMLLNARS